MEINNYIVDEYKIREMTYLPDEGTDNGHTMICVPGGGMCAGNHHYLASELGRYGYQTKLLETLFVKNRATDVIGKKDSEITSEDMSKILSEAIDCARYDNKTGEERKINTVGHSMGGYSVLENLDERVDRAIIYGTPDIKSIPAADLINSLVKVTTFLNINLPIRPMIKMMMSKHTVDYFMKEMTKDPNYDTKNCPTHYPSSYMHSMLDIDIMNALEEADTPVSVLCGEHDKVTERSLDMLEEVAEQNDSVEFILIPDAYHIRPCVKGDELVEFTDILDSQIRPKS
jgi:pimeloyl-ACP methyl ester carboxylesterase